MRSRRCMNLSMQSMPWLIVIFRRTQKRQSEVGVALIIISYSKPSCSMCKWKILSVIFIDDHQAFESGHTSVRD